MRVVNRAHHLLEKPAGGGFRHTAIVDNVVEQLSLGIFYYHYDVCWGGNNLIPMNIGRRSEGAKM